MTNRKIIDISSSLIRRFEGSSVNAAARAVLLIWVFLFIVNVLQVGYCAEQDDRIQKRVLLIDSFNQDLSNNLPHGNKVLFRELGLWDLYKGYVIGAIIILALQAMLIFGLLTNRMRRKKAEISLAEMNTNLEAMVIERTHELESANKELRMAKKQQEDLIMILSQLNKQLDLNSRIDALTGLFNRRHIKEKIQDEMKRLHRTGRSFAIIISDVDYFKQVNDTYGHNGGDFLLRSVANELCNAVRDYDTVARWGGEEFLCLLPETDANTATTIAERMRSLIANKNFVWEGVNIPIRMTFGVAIAGRDDKEDQVIARADQALYKGKKSGRNKVVVI